MAKFDRPTGARHWSVTLTSLEATRRALSSWLRHLRSWLTLCVVRDSTLRLAVYGRGGAPQEVTRAAGPAASRAATRPPAAHRRRQRPLRRFRNGIRLSSLGPQHQIPNVSRRSQGQQRRRESSKHQGEQARQDLQAEGQQGGRKAGRKWVRSPQEQRQKASQDAKGLGTQTPRALGWLL